MNIHESASSKTNQSDFLFKMRLIHVSLQHVDTVSLMNCEIHETFPEFESQNAAQTDLCNPLIHRYISSVTNNQEEALVHTSL